MPYDVIEKVCQTSCDYDNSYYLECGHRSYTSGYRNSNEYTELEQNTEYDVSDAKDIITITKDGKIYDFYKDVGDDYTLGSVPHAGSRGEKIQR